MPSDASAARACPSVVRLRVGQRERREGHAAPQYASERGHVLRCRNNLPRSLTYANLCEHPQRDHASWSSS